MSIIGGRFSYKIFNPSGNQRYKRQFVRLYQMQLRIVTAIQTTLTLCVRSMLGVHHNGAIHMWQHSVEGLRTLALFTVIIQSNGTIFSVAK